MNFNQSLILGLVAIIANTLAYAGSTANTGSTFFTTPPEAVRIKITLASGDYSAGKTALGTIQTSPDNTNWITTGVTTGTLSADGTTDVNINTAILKYLRVQFTGTATATITVTMLSDAPSGALSDGAIGQEDRTAVNGLTWCNTRVILDEPITFSGSTVNGGATALPGPTATAGYLAVTTSARTQGTVTPKVQFSPDGTTFFDSGDTISAISTNTTTLFKLTKGIAGFVRLVYTAAGSFDGVVSTAIYTDGSWSS